MSDSLTRVKDPAARKNYGLIWEDWLEGDTIVTSAWDIPDGLTAFAPDSHTGIATTVWLAGGDLGKDYEVANTITTAGGLTDKRTVKILVRPQ